MRLELEADGVPVEFVIINAVSADNADDRESLYDRTAIPLLQDIEEVNVWSLHHGGVKDDFLVYKADGTLSAYLAIADDTINTVLSEDEGYDTLKQAVIDAQ